MNEYLDIYEKLGLPIVVAVGLAYGCYKLIMFQQGTLVTRLKEIKGIIVGESSDHGLINKINKLENALIKMDTRIEMIHNNMELKDRRNWQTRGEKP